MVDERISLFDHDLQLRPSATTFSKPRKPLNIHLVLSAASGYYDAYRSCCRDCFQICCVSERTTFELWLMKNQALHRVKKNECIQNHFCSLNVTSVLSHRINLSRRPTAAKHLLCRSWFAFVYSVVVCARSFKLQGVLVLTVELDVVN